MRNMKIAGVTGTFVHSTTTTDEIDKHVNAAVHDLVQCSSCGQSWKSNMMDSCIACGLGDGADQWPGICPTCMRTHRCVAS